MSNKMIRCFFASLLYLSACSDEKNVVLQPGTFSEEWPTALRGKLIEGKKCSVDAINGVDTHKQKLTVKSGEPLTLSGWVFSDKDGIQPVVYVQLVGPALTYTAVTNTRTIRPDVIDFFKLDANSKAGFELQAVQAAEPSEYRLDVLQPGEHGVVQCETPAVIKIDPAPAS